MPTTPNSASFRPATPNHFALTPLKNSRSALRNSATTHSPSSTLTPTTARLQTSGSVTSLPRTDSQSSIESLRAPSTGVTRGLSGIDAGNITELPRASIAASSELTSNEPSSNSPSASSDTESQASSDSEKSPVHKKPRPDDSDASSESVSESSEDEMSEDSSEFDESASSRGPMKTVPIAFTVIDDEGGSDEEDGDDNLPPGLSRIKAAIMNSVLDSLKTDINSEAFFVEIFGQEQGQKIWQELGNRTGRQLDVLAQQYGNIAEKLLDIVGDPHVPQPLFVGVLEMGTSILRDLRKQPQLLSQLQTRYPDHFALSDGYNEPTLSRITRPTLAAKNTTALTPAGFFDEVDSTISTGLKQQPHQSSQPPKRMKQEQLASQMVKIQAFNKLYEEARSSSLQSRVESSNSMETIPGTDAHYVKIKGLSLDDLIVPPATKAQFEALIDQIKHSDVYKQSGAQQLNGILLYGPPGTGKTLAARVLASCANEDAAFISCSGASFHKPLLGAGAGAVKAVFESARARSMMSGKPCFVFIDEFDSLAKSRKGDSASSNEAGNTLMELLHQLDGLVSTEAEVILIAATNHRDRLDGASIRPGRIDKHILMETPHQAGRMALLNHFQKKQGITVEAGALERLAQDANTGGYSGADIEQLINEGARLRAYAHGASKAPLPPLSLNHLMEARKRIANGDRSELPGNAQLINASGDDAQMPTLDQAIVDREKMNSIREIVENFNDQEGRDLYQMSPHSTLYLGGKDGSKRQLVKAIAGTLKAPLIVASPTELTSKYVGESMQNAKALLRATQGYPVKPVVLLLEDLDQILQGDHSHNEERNMVNSLMAGIQSLKDNTSVLVVGTGRADANQLGQRLNRNMHTLFQQVMDINEPDEPSRHDILTGLLNKQKHVFSDNIDPSALAKKTSGLCHHDFVDILEDAKNHANQRRKTERAAGSTAPLDTFKVTMEDISWAIDKRLSQKNPQDNRLQHLYI